MDSQFRAGKFPLGAFKAAKTRNATPPEFRSKREEKAKKENGKKGEGDRALIKPVIRAMIYLYTHDAVVITTATFLPPIVLQNGAFSLHTMTVLQIKEIRTS